MKLHYKGTYDLNPDSLPAAPAKKDAVPFKEPDSIEKIAWIANGIALVLLVVLAIPIVALYKTRLIFSIGFWIGGGLSLLTCFPHEILHALCFKDDVYLYTNLRQGMLFVIGTETMSKRRFIFMSMLPNRVFGVLPYGLGLLFPSCSVLLGLGWCAITMGAGDYLNVFHALTQMPKGAKTYMSGIHSWWFIPEENEDR
ncbi:DUF3267 domain-containing protein [Dubosiella muris]|uniref:DUF3267 domain-containing protein n=1 Tax=Dubosiella muris TaxID=3038133 RepID=A0AC61R6R1_9FIRM|nr:DUF3267 domain-containing protein [Dubosiella muris]TGY65316.1 DUF3267 domain-containing protein [Dubosiella muris]